VCFVNVTILASVKILRYCTVRSCDRLCRLPDDGFVKPKHVGAFIVIFNVNFNILKQFKCALVGQIKDLICSMHDCRN